MAVDSLEKQPTQGDASESLSLLLGVGLLVIIAFANRNALVPAGRLL